MARSGEIAGNETTIRVDALTQGGQVRVPDDGFIANADFLRDGQDLVLRHPDGGSFVVENYFSAMPPPTLVNEAGAGLGPAMVRAFVQPAHEAQRYAQAGTQENDESPIGLVSEVKGEATITRADGTVEKIVQGMAVYEGDVVETDSDGAVNIIFIDETSFAVSQNARLAVDEYVFDPASGSGTQSFSVLRGMFVFVSGMIGREDPDDVEINTPIGNIGIRGTTIAGNVDSGEITIIEGAIVLRTLDGKTETTLATQFETARFNAGGTIEHLGVQDGAAVAAQFGGMQEVAGAFFAGIGQAQAAPAPEAAPQNPSPAPPDAGPEVVPPGGYNETSFDGGQDAGFGQAAGASPQGGHSQSAPAHGAPAAAGGGVNGGGAADAYRPGPLEGTMQDHAPPAGGESVISAPPSTTPSTPPVVTPPAGTAMNVTINANGTYAGGTGDDIFTTNITNFGMVSGGGGMDRLVLGPAMAGSVMDIHEFNLNGVETIDATNGAANVLNINYVHGLTLQNHDYSLIVRVDGADTVQLNFAQGGFQVADISAGSISFSDGVHTIGFNGVDWANMDVAGLGVMLPGTVLANGLTFRGYGENGTLDFENGLGTAEHYAGPSFNNVRIGGTANDVEDIYLNDYYIDTGAGNDTIHAHGTGFAESYFDGGAGFDRLLFETGGTLDLSALGTNQFHNFEEIGFQTTGPQTIRFSLDQIFQLMEQSDMSNQLYISDGGNTGPKTLEITGGDIAALADSVMTVGAYNEYSFDMAGTIHTLLVAENVAVVAV